MQGLLLCPPVIRQWFLVKRSIGNFKKGLFTGLFLTAFAFGCGSDDDDTGLMPPDDGETGEETGGEGEGPGEPVEPLDLGELEAGEWTFIPNPNMVCMDGSTSGFGVRLKEGATKLLIHLQDGGACYNDPTCTIVFNQIGFNASAMSTWGTNTGSFGIFSEDNSPFEDYSLVFVPYCGGDAHGGNTSDGFGGRTQQGFSNVTAMLDAVVPAFSSNTEKVVLGGASAGALGVLLN